MIFLQNHLVCVIFGVIFCVIFGVIFGECTEVLVTIFIINSEQLDFFDVMPEYACPGASCSRE